MYKVIGPTRTRTFRVLWMLEELGVPYEHLPHAPRSEEAKVFNPLGKVPALVDGEEVIADSVAIMTYLADKHGRLTAAPGTVVRARQDALTLWLIDEMDAILWSAAKHSFALPENLRVPAVIPSLHGEFSMAAETLTGWLNGPYLIGDALSLPDLLAVHCINWSVGAKFPRVPEALHLYAKSLRERPAYQAAFSR